MPTLTLVSDFTVGTLVWSAENIKNNYLYGVPLLDPKTGQVISDKVLEFYIQSATEEIQRLLGIYLQKTTQRETLDFQIEDYYAKYNPLKLTYPVLSITSIKGRLGESEILELPKEWIAFAKRDYVNSRNVFTIVNGTSNIQFNTTQFISYFGFPTGLSIYNRSTGAIPCFWDVTYETGFCGIIPYDILDVIGMMATIPLLAIIGDVRDAGLSSKELSIDGVKSSYSTTSSATSSAYSARILEYRKLIDAKVKELKRHFEAIIVESV